MNAEKLLQIKMLREDAERYKVPKATSPDARFTDGYIAALKRVERILGVLE